MKKTAFLLLALAVLSIGANDFPNGSFEHDVLPVWNRMPDQEVTAPGSSPYAYAADAVSGKRSLRLAGKKIRFSFESNAAFARDKGVFALFMKASGGGAKVRVRAVFYADTLHTATVEKTFAVNGTWRRFELRVGTPFGKYGRAGAMGPVVLEIDPGKNDVLIDDCVFSGGEKAPAYQEGPAGGVPEREMELPTYLPLPQAGSFGAGPCREDIRRFRLFPGAAGPEKNAPLTGVMLFPRSKVFFASGSFALYDGEKKLAAAFTPAAAWPQDGSLASLRVDFAADTGKTPKTLELRFTPGAKSADGKRGTTPKKVLTRGGVAVDPGSAALWEKNGSLGRAVLKGTDYAGKSYSFRCDESVPEIDNALCTVLLRRGKMVSSDGLSLGTVDVRLTVCPARPGAELEVALANTSDRFVLIRELYWECEDRSAKAGERIAVTGEPQKKRFTFLAEKDGKISRRRLKVETPEALPPFTLRTANGRTLHVFDGAAYFPSVLEAVPNVLRGALWPGRAKALSLAPGLTLCKRFLISPVSVKGDPDRPASVMPAAEDFAAARVMIPVCAADKKRFPFFEERIKDGLGRFSPGEIAGNFCFGQFNYGDHPGDGGWANLESFEDYVLYHRALRAEDPRLFRLALTATRHYICVDTDIRTALPHVHCANHVVSGTPFGHAWIPGVIGAYLLSGDPAVYQTARRMFGACLALPVKTSEIQQGRNFGFFLLTLAEGYAVFNDKAAAERFMTQLKYQIDRYAKGPLTAADRKLQRTDIPRQNSLFYVRNSGLVPFHCWYGLAAFLKMYGLFPDPLIKETLEKEFANIMNLEMTYRPQLETHWPGLPAEKMFPAIATDYLLGRGAFFYPVLARYARLAGETKYRDLAVNTLYCGLLAARNAGTVQDVFMASPLADLPETFDEKAKIAEMRGLLWNGAAPELANGGFGDTIPYRDLVIPKNGIGRPVYPEWALEKPYPKHWHFIEGKQIISSNSMTLRGYFYTLDDKDFGESAPSLRLELAQKPFFNGGNLTSAKFRLTPGEWEYSLAVKLTGGAELPRAGLRILPLGGTPARIGAAVTAENRLIADDSADKEPAIYDVSYAETGKPGWKKLSFRFRVKEKALGIFRVVYKLRPKVKTAQIRLDDAKVRRIGD